MDDHETGEIEIAAVKDALEHLYQNVDLATGPLANLLPETRPIADVVERAQILRDILLDAIEALRPLRPAPPHVLASRSYEVLSLRYVSGLSVEEVAERLAVGERQVYRDLRKAEEELTAILRSRTSPAQSSQGDLDQLTTAAPPPERSIRDVDLVETLHSALETVAPLARQRHIRWDCRTVTDHILVTAQPGILKQILVQLLSAAAQNVEDRVVYIRLTIEEAGAYVNISVPAIDLAPRIDLFYAAVQLAQSLGFTCTLTSAPKTVTVVLGTRLRERLPVLIVEDNPGARQLYERYLADSQWQPIFVDELDNIAGRAASIAPAAIILDLLMPEVDGWTLLQELHIDPRTKDIPVILCSVIEDPELGAALGASLSLKKPVSRLQLLTALAEVTRPGTEA